jgi:hypothetical protein
VSGRIVSWNPDTATQQKLHFEGDDLVLHTQQDVTEILELNKAQFAAENSKAVEKWKGEWHQVARIPLSIYFQLQKRGLLKKGRENDLKAWLNDNENRFFRTRAGRV